MMHQEIKEELKALEVERLKRNSRKLEEDPVAMSLVVAYEQSLMQARHVKKKESDEDDEDPAPSQKAS